MEVDMKYLFLESREFYLLLDNLKRSPISYPPRIPIWMAAIRDFVIWNLENPYIAHDAHDWLSKINNKHTPFDVSKWKPISERYKHLPIKVLWKTDLEDILKMPTTEELEGK